MIHWLSLYFITIYYGSLSLRFEGGAKEGSKWWLRTMIWSLQVQSLAMLAIFNPDFKKISNSPWVIIIYYDLRRNHVSWAWLWWRCWSCINIVRVYTALDYNYYDSSQLRNESYLNYLSLELNIFCANRTDQKLKPVKWSV